MKVRPISITKSLIPQIEGPLELVAYCARVSNPANQENVSTGPRLVDYLVRHRHWSPLEMVDITLEIVTTRDIARQLLRHRSFSFQEFSQRYAEVAPDFVMREARAQDSKNRQNSLPISDPQIQQDWAQIQELLGHLAISAYSAALSVGIAKEVARSILPEGMTESRLYMKGSLRSWLHYLEVRTDPSTQKEHRVLAEEIRRVIHEVTGFESQIQVRDSQGSTPPHSP